MNGKDICASFKKELERQKLELKELSKVRELQQILCKEISKLLYSYEEIKIDCDYCENEKELILTSDGNPIYVGVENGKYHLINYDSYKGNKIEINYCPMCGKRLIINKI